MGRPYSDDLRVRVVAAMEGGGHCRAVGEAFGDSLLSWESGRQRWFSAVSLTWMSGLRPYTHRAWPENIPNTSRTDIPESGWASKDRKTLCD